MTILHTSSPISNGRGEQTGAQLPSAASFKRYLAALGNVRLNTEVLQFYRGRCAALTQEIGAQAALFSLDGCRPARLLQSIVEQQLASCDSRSLDCDAPGTAATSVQEGSGSGLGSIGDTRVCRYAAYYATSQSERLRRQLDFAAIAAAYRPQFRSANLPGADSGDMLREVDRRLTFQTAAAADAALLAAGGLYFTGDGEMLRCAFCNAVVDGFGDSPLERHRRDFPSCPMLQGFHVGNVKSPGSAASGGGQPESALKRPVQCTEPTNGHVTIALSRESPECRQVDWDAFDCAQHGWETARMSSVPSPGRLASLEAEATSGGALQPAWRPPRHPDFADHATRLASLQTAWFPGLTPHWLMAKAGFHCGESAISGGGAPDAACFECGVRLPAQTLLASDAAAGACPWLLHARLLPACPHLLRERGAAYVIAVLAAFPAIVASSASAASGAGGFAGIPADLWHRRRLLRASTLGAAAVRFRNDRRAIRARLDLAPTRLLARLLSADVDDPSCAEAALRVQLGFSGDDYRSGECQLEAAWHLRDRTAECGLRSASTLADDWEAAADKRRRQAVGWHPATPLARGRRPLPLCARCEVSGPRVCLLPCGHCCLCTECEPQATVCPVCRVEIAATCLFCET